MGLEGGLGIGLLASTFDVESVVFPMRGSHFLAFYGAGGRPWDGLVGSTFDVESVVFLMRGSHFLAFYGAGGRPCDGLVGVRIRSLKCGIP